MTITTAKTDSASRTAQAVSESELCRSRSGVGAASEMTRPLPESELASEPVSKMTRPLPESELASEPMSKSTKSTPLLASDLPKYYSCSVAPTL